MSSSEVISDSSKRWKKKICADQILTDATINKAQPLILIFSAAVFPAHELPATLDLGDVKDYLRYEYCQTKLNNNVRRH